MAEKPSPKELTMNTLAKSTPTKSNDTRPIGLTLQLEGLAIAATAIWVYADTGAGWLLFAALILVPDLFMLGYLRGARPGARVYNLGHSYTTPLTLLALGYGLDIPALVPPALIWVAHIGADRAMGYGLKYASGFRDTHLSRA
jgi:hypothetical protein